MRKSFVLLMLAVMSMTFTPATSYANNASTIPVTERNNGEMPERVKTLLSRLDEIKEMDKSTLTRTDKKELRKEVKAIRSELRATNNGVYLSIGAIIIIILLLILIL